MDDHTTNAPEARPTGRRAAIDMRRFEPRERFALLELSLSALGPGETLEVTFEQWPEVFVRHLERAYGDAFAWRARGQGEDWSCLEIRRRPLGEKGDGHG